MTKAELVDHGAGAVQVPTRYTQGTPWKCGALAASGCASARRVPAVTHARGPLSRFRPRGSPHFAWGKPSKRWCKPVQSQQAIPAMWLRAGQTASRPNLWTIWTAGLYTASRVVCQME